MKLLVASSTDVGHVRSGNEDSYVVDDELGLFAVADGMGGHRGGEVASSTAIEALHAAIAEGHAVEAAIHLANTAVFARAASDDALSGMGTTMTAFVQLGDALVIGHVGDSRAYLSRGGALQKLTVDHSLVEELVREGRITAEEASAHPRRSIITRAVGIEPEVEVDLYPVTVIKNDRFLICSDGLTDMVSEFDVAVTLARPGSPHDCAQELVDSALANGGHDNITVVVIDVLETDTDPEELAVIDPAASAADDVTEPFPAPFPEALPEPSAAPKMPRRWWQRRARR